MGNQRREVDRIPPRYFLDWMSDRLLTFTRWGVSGYKLTYMDPAGDHHELITRRASTIQEMCLEAWQCEFAAGRFKSRWWLRPDESEAGPLFAHVRQHA